MQIFRFSYLWEILLLFSIVLGIDHYFFNGDRFWEVQLHPFFFIVVLISVQYGTNKGLITAVLSTVFLLAGNLPKQALSQDLFEYLFYISYRPMLWVALAILLGGFRDKYYRNLESAQEKLIAKEKQADEFCRAYKLLDKERNRLEINLTSQLNSVPLFNKIAEKTKTLDPGEIFNSLLDITQAHIKPEKCSWFKLKNYKLELASQKGWKEEDRYFDSFSPPSRLYQEVIENKQFLSVTNSQDEPFLMEQGVLAGPIYSRDTGKVYGMIKIENMGFLGLNLTVLETFKGLCEWLGKLLETSIQYQKSQRRILPRPQEYLFPQKEFRHASEFLLHLSNRVSFESHTIDLRLSENTSLNPDIHKRLKRIMVQQFRRDSRKTDLIFENSKSKLGYIILLPNTSLTEAQYVSKKLCGVLTRELATSGADKPFLMTINSLEKIKFDPKN